MLHKNRIYLDEAKTKTLIETIIAFYLVAAKKLITVKDVPIKFKDASLNHLEIRYTTKQQTKDPVKKNAEISSAFPKEQIYELLKKIAQDSEINCNLKMKKVLCADVHNFPLIIDNNINKLELIKLTLNAKFLLMRLGGLAHFYNDSIVVEVPIHLLLDKNLSLK